ncbi:hypothetical protein KAF25_011196 [Fusarium avenaceum]|uniref:Apple domain-containing protein n=1 Tax=Fusarium avenaceum TaxID=40199 RepID=A0A9P7H269_9HYPO|nr:hypothetical protein KAF25_011196 [Fusarium avenaceum]
MVSVKFVILFLALGTEALAATSSTLTCLTKLGTSSIASNKIPRATTTVSNKVTVIKRIIRKVNVIVIPRPRTTVETEISKTTVTTEADPDVETATEIVTDEQTKRESRYITTTSTSTSFTTVSKTSTTTIAPPAGFTALLDAPDYRAKIKARANVAPLNGALGAAKAQYPQRIDCTKRVPTTTVKTISTTIQGPRRTLQPKTKTRVVTSIQTIVETQYPPKVTETDTITVSPTVTEYDEVTVEATAFETVTVETTVPETFYQACGNNNILRTANGGHGFVNIITLGKPYATTYVPNISKQYDCCVACVQQPGCFFSYSGIGANYCYIYLSSSPAASVCPNGQVLWANYYTRPNAPVQYEVSNGPCGILGNIGDQ